MLKDIQRKMVAMRTMLLQTVLIERTRCVRLVLKRECSVKVQQGLVARLLVYNMTADKAREVCEYRMTGDLLCVCLGQLQAVTESSIDAC